MHFDRRRFVHPEHAMSLKLDCSTRPLLTVISPQSAVLMP